MTLILTYISKYGIIHASDSNLSANNRPAGTGQKVFEIPYLTAGLTLAGTYMVENQRMDEWMPRFIEEQSTISSITLAQFAKNLGASLQKASHLLPFPQPSLIHIGGYVTENSVTHPEFWFVRNIHGMDLRTGEYDPPTHDFEVTEDFWIRDYRKEGFAERFEQSGYQIYINGFASGRISYLLLHEAMSQFLGSIWNNPRWMFRPPNSLQETELFVRIYFRWLDALFRSSDYPAPYIGGEPQTYVIPRPQ